MPKRGLAGIIYGKEGVGKTSVGLQFPGPVKCLSMLENGYEYLEDVKATPENSINIHVKDFKQLLTETSKITSGTLLLDSLKGVQKIIFDYTCETYYGGKWDKFYAYSEGPRKFAPPILQNYLDVCTTLTQKGVNVIFLGHMGIASIPNAQGADWLCHVLLMDDGDKGGMRSTMTSWAGFIFFLTNEVIIETKTDVQRDGTVLEGKAMQNDSRTIFTTTSNVHQAKNRWNMVPKIPMGKTAQEAYANIWKHVPQTYKD